MEENRERKVTKILIITSQLLRHWVRNLEIIETRNIRTSSS